MAEGQVFKEVFELAGKQITLETGKLAGQADGAVVVSCGNTVLLLTAVGSKDESDRDFFPLTIDVEERMYAAGKIPGGFFRREGRPSEKSTLTARLTDRPLRPNFPEGMRIEVQVVATILSVDQKNPPDVLGVLGASAALMISDIPFNGPVGVVRVGQGGGGFIVNPTYEELDQSDLDLVVAGILNRETNEVDVIMVEAEADQVPESELIDALEFSKKYIMDTIRAQIRLQEMAGRPKREVSLRQFDLPAVERVVPDFAEEPLPAGQGMRRRAADQAGSRGQVQQAQEGHQGALLPGRERGAPAELRTVLRHQDGRGGPPPSDGGRPARGRTPPGGDPPHLQRSGPDKPHPRLRALHPGADPGAHHPHPGRHR